MTWQIVREVSHGRKQLIPYIYYTVFNNLEMHMKGNVNGPYICTIGKVLFCCCLFISEIMICRLIYIYIFLFILMLHLLSFVVIHFLYVLNFLAQGAGLADSTTGTYPEQRKGVWTYSISQCLWQLCRGHKNACICWRSQGKALIEFVNRVALCHVSCRFYIICTLLPFSIFYFYTHSNCSYTGYDTHITMAKTNYIITTNRDLIVPDIVRC